MLETAPSASVGVSRFQFFSIFGFSREVDDATGKPSEGARFVSLPLFLFRVFAEPSSASPGAEPADEALLKANLYELFMVRPPGRGQDSFCSGSARPRQRATTARSGRPFERLRARPAGRHADARRPARG